MSARNDHFLGVPELTDLGVTCTGRNIKVHESVVLIDAERLTIAEDVRIDPFCVISAAGEIRLGRHIHIGAHVSLIGGGGILIDDFAGVSHGAKLLSTSDDLSGGALTGPTVSEELRAVDKRPIHIGRHAVIGAGSVILPGVTLGDGAVVGALSLVRDDVAPWTIWAGIPARHVGNRGRAVLELERQVQRAANP